MTTTTNSRLARVADAVRPEMKARLMLSGPSGSGKTRKALIIAAVLAPGAKALVIDTEEESALTYADSYAFKHLPWDPPYDPRELAAVVAEASREYPVIIIDSASHFWTDDGGTLGIAAGKFTGWAAARPAQKDLITAVLRAPAHMIVCVRSKMDHAQELDSSTGKQVVTKLGMAPIQDSTFEYEMNVSAEVDMAHKLMIGKTRCDVLDGRQFPMGHAEDFAAIYGDWLKGGEPVADTQAVDGLVERMNAITDDEARKECKRTFVDRFGRPEHLAASRTADAWLHVAAYDTPTDDNQPDPDPQPDPEPPTVAPVPDTQDDEPVAVASNGNGHSPPPPEAVPVNRLAGVTISGKMASALHRAAAELAKELGHTKPGARSGTTVADTAWSEGTLDALIRSASNTRTDAGVDLTVDEERTVRRYLAELAAGDMVSTVADNGNVTLVVGDQTYRFIRTPNDGLVHVGAVAS